jgi:hypothetical protein
MHAEYQQKALSGLMPTYLKPGVSKQMKAWQRDVSSSLQTRDVSSKQMII